MFNKEEYRKRREQGLRGQGDAPVTQQIAKWTEEDYKAGKCGKKAIGSDRTSDVTMHYTKKGLVAVTRKMNRNKVVDRHTTKKGHVYGTKIGGRLHNKLENAKRKFAKEHKGEHIPSEEQRIHLENHPLRVDPSKTNHQRNLARKEKRDADTAARRAARSAETATV